MSNRNTTQRDRDRRTIARTQPPCALCGAPIDYTLTTLPGKHGAKCRNAECKGCTPHPMRFEVDHVVPLDKGGPDLIHNKQPTHRTCNSTKRARLIAPIVRRSGALD